MGEQKLPPVDPSEDPGSNVVPLSSVVAADRTRRQESLQARLRTFRDLNELPDADHEQMLGELLVRGHRLLIGADSGHGKSTFVNDMIRCLATGEVFLESKHFTGIPPGKRDDGAPYRVLVIDCEQSDRTVKKRLREAGIQDLEYCHYWLIPEGLDISNPAMVDYQVLETALVDLKPDVVVIDPLFKMHKGDPNDAKLAAMVMSAVDNWRATYNFGLIIPVHVRKLASGQAANRKISLSDVYGAGTWTWGSEVVVGIERHKDPVSGRQSSTLRWLKCRDDASMFEQSWGMVLTTGGVFRRLLDASDTTPAGKEEAKERGKTLLLNLLVESGRRFTIRELWEETRQATGFEYAQVSGIVTQWWSVSPLNPKEGKVPKDEKLVVNRRRTKEGIEYWWGPSVPDDTLPGLRVTDRADEDEFIEFGEEEGKVEKILSGDVLDDDDMED